MNFRFIFLGSFLLSVITLILILTQQIAPLDSRLVFGWFGLSLILYILSPLFTHSTPINNNIVEGNISSAKTLSRYTFFGFTSTLLVTASYLYYSFFIADGSLVDVIGFILLVVGTSFFVLIFLFVLLVLGRKISKQDYSQTTTKTFIQKHYTSLIILFMIVPLLPIMMFLYLLYI